MPHVYANLASRRCVITLLDNYVNTYTPEENYCCKMKATDPNLAKRVM